MSLRVRLALTILLTALPLAAGLLWLRADLRRRQEERSLRDMVVTMMQTGGRQLCEMFPDAFAGGHGMFGLGGIRGHVIEPGSTDVSFPPFRSHDGDDGGAPFPLKSLAKLMGPPHLRPEHHFALLAYRADLSGGTEKTPAMPAGIRETLAAGADTASETYDREGVSVLRLGIRMPWTEGPCAVMVAERARPPGAKEDHLVLWGLAVLCGGVLVAVFLAAGPLVGRIRRLQTEVERAAASRYVEPATVEGRDEIADLARTFNEAGEEVRTHIAAVEAREETLRRFVADTTHDVMIPLTVLQGHLSAIRERIEAGEAVDPAEVRSSLEEAHYIGSLLHNLDAVAKLEAAPRDLKNGRVDLRALVGRVVDRHRPIARTRGIEVEFTVPDDAVEASGDVTLLEQAVSNVVHNAVRYNDDGGHVSVLLELSDERFALRVLDDGPGVPPGLLPRLADRRFRSLEARTRQGDGRGIGLAIAKDVAERHGLELTFANLDPKGLQVRFEGGVR